VTVKDLINGNIDKNKLDFSRYILYTLCCYRNCEYGFYVAKQGKELPIYGKYFSRIWCDGSLIAEKTYLENL